MTSSVEKTFSNGDVYVGSVDEKGRPHGHGEYRRANGATYIGQHSHGLRHGMGEFRSADGSRYVGEWADGVQQGRGTFQFGVGTAWDGDEYRGEFQKGVWQGEGEHIFANGDHYTGDYRDGKQHGVGKFTNANGSAFVGQFKAGVPHGFGAFFLRGRRIPRTTGTYESGVLVQSDRSVPDDAPEPTLAELRARFAATPDPAPAPAPAPASPVITSASSSNKRRSSNKTRSGSNASSAPSDDEDDGGATVEEKSARSIDASLESAVGDATEEDIPIASSSSSVSSPGASSSGRRKKRSSHNSSTASPLLASVTANAAAAAAVPAVPSLSASPPSVAGQPLAALEAKAKELRRQLIAVEKLISARTPVAGSPRQTRLPSEGSSSSTASAVATAPGSPLIGDSGKRVSVTTDFAERPLLAREDAAIARLRIDATSTSDDDEPTDDVVEVDGVKRVDFRRRIKQLLFSSQPASDMAVAQSTVTIDIDQLHKAELLEPLGGGGSGCKIYRASAKGFSFVVKLYRTTSLTPLDEELIKKEILIMEALDHPNIVHYIGHDFSQPDCVRLYMELFLSTLHREIRNRSEPPPTRRPFAVDELLALALGIANGLQYLHTLPCPIVHRDLKCLAKNTPVLMYDGTVKLVQSVAVGERVMGDDGTPRNVLSVTAGQDELVRVSDLFTCNSAHVLSLKLAGLPALLVGDARTVQFAVVKRNVADGTAIGLRIESRTFATEAEARLALAASTKGDAARMLGVMDEPLLADEPLDIAVRVLLDERCVDSGARAHLACFFADALEFAPRAAPVVDPYSLGFWLGGGRLCDDTPSAVLDHFAQRGAKHSFGEPFAELVGTKQRLPIDIVRGSVATRLALLAGVVDASSIDGSLSFAVASPTLRDDVTFVARSVGFRTAAVEDDDVRVTMWSNMQRLPCLVARKSPSSRAAMCVPLDLKPVGRGDFYGFMLDGNHRFVLGDSFAVTHNSENVFLVDAGNNDVRVKIGDFGEAKAMQDKWLMTRYVGTAEFRAPEVYGATAKGHNEKADIWSYGMVLFELLALDLPYRATVKSHFDVPKLVEAGIRATLPELPPMYADIVPLYVTCTESDPRERPSAKELVKRLKKMVAKRDALRKAAKEAKDKEKAAAAAAAKK